MKKIFFIGAILFANFSFSQIYTVDGTITASGATRTVTLSGKNLNFVPVTTSPAGGNLFMNGTTGNIGLGTLSPTSRFQINSGDIFLNSTSSKLLIGTVANFNDATANWGIKSDKPFLIANTTYPSIQLRSTNPLAFGWADIAVATGDYYYSNNSKAGDVVFRGYTPGSLIFNNDATGKIKFETKANSLAGTYSKIQMTIDKDGNIGMGTETPSQKLDVVGNAKISGQVSIGGTIPTVLGAFPITASGSVSNYNLFVKGGILTDEVKVALNSTWADYVFAKNYTLKPLSEVEQFINTNGHLQNVPSAKQVKEEGINVGDMAKIQLEKIEELTLYIIALNKKLEEQDKKIEVLVQKLNK